MPDQSVSQSVSQSGHCAADYVDTKKWKWT